MINVKFSSMSKKRSLPVKERDRQHHLMEGGFPTTHPEPHPLPNHTSWTTHTPPKPNHPSRQPHTLDHTSSKPHTQNHTTPNYTPPNDPPPKPHTPEPHTNIDINVTRRVDLYFIECTNRVSSGFSMWNPDTERFYQSYRTGNVLRLFDSSDSHRSESYFNELIYSHYFFPPFSKWI